MAYGILNKPNTDGPTGIYPQGNIRDNGGTNNGTPVNKMVYADFHQFFDHLVYSAGYSFNNLPDNATNGYQYFDALKEITQKYIGTVQLSANTNMALYYGLFSAAAFQVIFQNIGASGTMQHTLPPSSSLPDGASFTFFNSDIYDVDILPVGSDDIDSGAGCTLFGKGDFVTLVLDKGNQNWNFLCKGVSREKRKPIQISGGGITLTKYPYSVMYIANPIIGANFTWTLPPGNLMSDGEIITVKNSSGYQMTLAPNGSDGIDGFTTALSLLTYADCVQLLWDQQAIEWKVISQKLGRTAIQNLTLSAGYSQIARCIKDTATNMVHLRGFVEKNNPASGDQPFTLPVGFRPNVVQNLSGTIQAATGATVAYSLTVNTNGVCQLYFGPSLTGITDFILDGMSFYLNW